MAFPTDFRGGTMVQPDGSYKDTPIPESLRKVGKKPGKKKIKVRARTSGRKKAARKKG